MKSRVSSPSSSSASTAKEGEQTANGKNSPPQSSPKVRPMPLGDFTPPMPIPNAEDYLEVPSLRQHLTPMPSPLKKRRSGSSLEYEGFVSDDDRVMLQALAFGSEDSAGATCVNGMSVDDVCIPLPQWGLTRNSDEA